MTHPSVAVRRSLSSAAVLTASLASASHATQTHRLAPHETIAAVARHFHVTVQDIAQANHLSNPDSVPDGQLLHIPAPPKRVRAEATMQRSAVIAGDRASLRLGPGTEYRRAEFCDKGTRVTVTARRDGWAQVELADGKRGWIRQDFVAGGRHQTEQVARKSERSDETPRRPGHKHNPALVAEGRDAKRRRLAHHAAQTVRMARKHRHPIEPEQVAHHKKHGAGRGEERTSHASRKHSQQVAHHSRYQAEQVAHHKSHSHHNIEVASRHSGRHHRWVPEADAPVAENDVVRTAYAYRGTPYVYGGASRGGFDCSGFTSYLYRQKGISLPHTARGQFHMGHSVGKGGMKAGDLVFFHTVTPGISHVGMYVGNGKFVHASSRRSGGVRVDSLSGGYYSKAFRGARRFK